MAYTTQNQQPLNIEKPHTDDLSNAPGSTPDDPEQRHARATQADREGHAVSSTAGRGAGAMSPEQRAGKDPVGAQVARENSSSTEEGERVKRVDRGAV